MTPKPTRRRAYDWEYLIDCATCNRVFEFDLREDRDAEMLYHRGHTTDRWRRIRR